MMTSSRRAYVWIWLPGQTSPVVAGLVERDDQDRYRYVFFQHRPLQRGET